MAGEIKHSWKGTVLTITSDSGTSSMDLKGTTGDIGPRGPQGRAGVVYDPEGNIVMEGYATEEYVQEMLEQVDVDLTGYATEQYVNNAIGAIPQPDLSNYATKEYVDDKVANAEVDLTGYATEAFVEAKIGEIPEVDLTGYATELYVEEKINEIELPNTDNFATKDYVDITTTIALSNHYTKDEIDEAIANLGPGTGGGGGSAGNNAVLTLQNNSGWLYKIISPDGECELKATWSSIEDTFATGNGVVTVTVNGINKLSLDVAQGSIVINAAPFLTVGSNSIRLVVTDVYGNSRSIIYSVEVVAASITSTFDATVPYTGEISFPYVVNGNVEKKIFFKLDGKQIGTASTTTSGRQATFPIPAQKHGAHTFEVYFTSVISGMTVESNHLYYDLICTEEGNNTTIIACPFNKSDMTQFETVQIYYSVYTPDSLTTDIELVVNNKVVQTLTVDRTKQLWAFRAETDGFNILKIRSGSVTKNITIAVTAADLGAEAETADLSLYLSSYGRSNNEANPASWTYKDIACEFEGYNWISDGWVPDENGTIVHRITGDARLTIPVKMFEKDARTVGKTIEIEFATRDTMDYDAVIASCMSGGVGFEMTAQKATIYSEQASINAQYKEDEHMRLTFVIEKKAENRLIYTYLDGIMCGAVQYVDNDNFAQSEPVFLTLGSNVATLDIYTIRVYENSLTRYQILDNWIADTQSIDERFARYNRNKIYDAYGNIIVSNLPKNLPYLILESATLPEFKGNVVPLRATYVDPMNENKSFVSMAEADVQGTSSAGYVRKNYIITYPETYQLRADSIPTNTFTYKADVASSEGANNVELVRLYNNASPYKTPPQLEDARVRQGIDGFPIVIFHNNGQETKFIGKYNFNNDKETPEVFGFNENDESWEIRNNTSNRVLFKNADFSGTDWLNDFKARHPVGKTDPGKLDEFVAWVASTDTTAATGVDGDTAEARLAKFKAELADHAEVQSALFYYLFTEMFLMVDSRAKNAFPTFFNNGKVCWLPYDMDTAMGINNEGSLAFGYELEDTDLTPEGKLVYNGQDSVFWNNLRDAYGDELKAMYQKLRSDNVISYEIVEKMFEDHQSVWPEAIWNEDAWYKYLQPLVENNNGSYLGMLQGSKEGQRKWWLYNRFRYLDSKYNAGDAEKDFITLRGYAKDDITVEPYADIYASILYGSYLVQERALRGQEHTLECPLDTLNDTEIYVYSASQLRDIGDLSGLKVGYADFASATRLQALKLGDSSSSYSNSNLTELYLGNNTLLKTLDVRNCPMLGSGEKQHSIDLTGCTNIEHVYFDGTTIKGCNLPNGGILKTLHLPSTITNLTIRNQKAITDLVVPSYDNVSTLRLENVGDKIDMAAILRKIKAGSRVRLIGVSWSFDTVAEVQSLFDILDTMKGLDENDNNLAKAQISGNIHIAALTSEQLDNLKSRYNTVTYTYDSLAYDVYYVNYDGTQLYHYEATEGSTAIDPVATGKISTPKKPNASGVTYTYNGWGTLPVITATTTITAQYKSEVAKYTVTFKSQGTTLSTATVTHGNSVSYTGTNPTAPSGQIFAGWYPMPKNVTSNMTVNALFASDSTTQEEIADSWSTILNSISDGTYASKYHRGMYKVLESSPYHKIYICGMGADRMSDGNPAPISWVSWHDMNAVEDKWHTDNTSYGALSWGDCSLRTTIQNNKRYLPAEVQNRIVAVQKTHNAYNAFADNAQYWQTTSDYLWIPSVNEYKKGEVYIGTTLISSDYNIPGPGGTTGKYVRYWLRDKYGNNVSGIADGTENYKYVCIRKTDELTILGIEPARTDDYTLVEMTGFCLA